MHLPVGVSDQRWRGRTCPHRLSNDPFDRLHYGIAVVAGGGLRGAVIHRPEATVGRVQGHITTFGGRHACLLALCRSSSSCSSFECPWRREGVLLRVGGGGRRKFIVVAIHVIWFCICGEVVMRQPRDTTNEYKGNQRKLKFNWRWLKVKSNSNVIRRISSVRFGWKAY